jgi:dimethylargininase
VIALTRAPSPALAAGERTHVERADIDIDTALAQHAAYEQALRRHAVEVLRLDELPEHPDAVFVEDAAVVTPELAVITRPGAARRRDEVASVRDALAAYLPVSDLPAPATLDGGDVLQAGSTVYVGRSSRTNEEGVAALAALLAPTGRRVVGVDVPGALHLKTACTLLPDGALLANPSWVDVEEFDGAEVVAVPADEPFAANTLTVGGTVLMAAGHPRTRDLLAARGLTVQEVEIGELAKAEAGLTCLSLLLPLPVAASA